MCSIGEMPQVLTACSSKPFKRKKDFSKSDWALLRYRSGCLSVRRVCHNHELCYLKAFLTRNKYCCDPKSSHPLVNRKISSRISVSLSRKSRGILNLVPGRGLCARCFQQVAADFKAVNSPLPTDDSDESDEMQRDTSDDDDDEPQLKKIEIIEQPGDDNEWTENPYVDFPPAAEPSKVNYKFYLVFKHSL